MGKSRISEKGRARQKRGKGEGKDYRPWIQAQDFNSQGVAVMMLDPITGRQMHFLSLAEKYTFYKLRWEEDIAEVKEQFPLEIEETTRIADEYGIIPAQNGEVHMTTDMFITHESGRKEAVSVKLSRAEVFAQDDGTSAGKRKANKAARTRQLLFIEKKYWNRKNVRFRLIFAEDFNQQYVHNIEQVMRCYDERNVRDDISLIKHMIAHRILVVDMTKKIDYRALADEHIRETGKWKKE